MPDLLEIDPTLAIPLAELRFTASRSSGPGGQHVNKVETRITLHFDVAGSPSLDDAQRRRVADRLATRIAKDGVLRLHVQQHRSQAANRELAVERFVELLREALRRRRPRRKTRPSRAALERRLDEKRQRSGLKRDRGGARRDD